MCALQLYISADPSLGRVDYSLLSDQMLMEMLIEDLDDETQKTFQDADGMYLDIWYSDCVTCDNDQEVTRIDRDSRDIVGSIQLRYVPPKVKVLSD